MAEIQEHSKQVAYISLKESRMSTCFAFRLGCGISCDGMISWDTQSRNVAEGGAIGAVKMHDLKQVTEPCACSFRDDGNFLGMTLEYESDDDGKVLVLHQKK